jgi:hypothetical protein
VPTAQSHRPAPPPNLQHTQRVSDLIMFVGEPKGLSYPRLRKFWKTIASCKVPRIRAFVLQVRATHRWRWVWSIAEMILTGETEVLCETPVTVPLCASHGLPWDWTRASTMERPLFTLL